MLVLLSDLEKAKKRTLLLIKLSILGFLSCIIVIIMLTAYYQELIEAYYPGFLALIYQELTLIEFFWMIVILLLFFFMNTIIWYYISYDLNKKSIKILNFVEKSKTKDIVCCKCGIERASENFIKKSNQGIKLVRIFNVEGYFCKRCYQHYSNMSLITIILIPIIYFLCIILIIPFLMGIGLSFVPKSHWFLYSTVFPVFIITIFTFVGYIIYNKIKISKIYNIKKQKFMT